MGMGSSPVLQVILAAVLWGTSGLFIRYLRLSAGVLSFFRLAVPTLILFVYLRLKGIAPSVRGNGSVLLASLLNAVRLFFYFAAYLLTTVGNAVVVLYTWPIMATIFSAVAFKERITKEKATALFVSFVGILLVYMRSGFSLSSRDFLGMSSMLLSATIYASTVVIFKAASHRYSAVEMAFYQNVVGAVLFLPSLLFTRPLPTLNQVAVATVFAATIGVVGFVLFFTALRRLKTSTASHLSYLEVVSAVVLGAVVLKEPVTWNLVVGGLLIIGSVAVLRRSNE